MKNRERYTWIGVTAFLLICIAFAIITPSAFARPAPTKADEYLFILSDLFKFIESNYVDEVEPQVLFEGAVDGLFESLGDPYSYYLSETDLNKLSQTTTGKYGGVGLYISKANPDTVDSDPNARYVRVVSPIEGTPAYKAGIHSGDYIIEIDGETTEPYNINEVVDRLTGEPGTPVLVRILRNDDVFINIEIIRAIIEVPTVKREMIPGNIGYLRIIQFTPYTDNRVRDAIEYFEEKNYTSLIIDVRDNPGGLLPAVVDITDFFLSSGPIVSTRGRHPEEDNVFYASSSVLVPRSIPIAILINHGSASASEILAGALKDTGRGTVIGVTSFGKGLVQQARYIGDGGFKLTMSRYYTPGGYNINDIGIEPDIIISADSSDNLSDEEIEMYRETYRTLQEEQRIQLFVKENPVSNINRVNSFISNLKDEGLSFRERDIRLLIQQEYYRKMDFPPVYELEYDKILKEAVRLIETGKIN